jgi:SPP1 gp7 family putative phage head morphogenesis protein
VAGENALLRDIGISHQIGLRRLSTGVTKQIVDLLNATDKDLVEQLKRYDPTSVQARYVRGRLDKLLKDVRALNKEVYKRANTTLRGSLMDIAEYEVGFQAKTLGKVAGVAVGAFNLPTYQQLVAAVTDEPFQGRLLSEWVSGLEEGRYARLRDAIRMGVVEGESIGDVVKRVQGTRELNYKDGVLAISRRSAEAMVRTAVSHTTTAAKQVMFEENKDLIDGWRFVATLESNTCEICAALDDGTVYAPGEGPYPPRHPNCRCTTVPVVKGGGAADRVTFNKWLKDQSPETQDEVLGPTRAELYREGGLSLNRFADDSRVYTLEQLRQIEPGAFLRAALYGGESPGPGYSEEAFVGPDGTVYTNNVVDAVKALWDGRDVDLSQPRQVSVLLDRLAQVSRDMERAGEDAPNFNLCRVTIEGTSLFCADGGPDYPRIQMPQLKGEPIPGTFANTLQPDARGEVDISSYFKEYLVGKGYKVDNGEEFASYLKASQNELNGAKVGELAHIERTTGLDDARLFISRDNYILDGHHRWAAMVGVDFDDNHPGDIKLDIARVDTDIVTLLQEARDFAGEKGIPQVAVGQVVATPSKP